MKTAESRIRQPAVRGNGRKRRLRPGRCLFYGTGSCPLAEEPDQRHRRLPPRDSAADFIFIPLEVRDWECSRFSMSARLEHVLGYMNCRVLGDLHGQRLSDIVRWRNCGIKTVRELIQLVGNVQTGDWSNWRDANGDAAGDYYQI